MKKLAVVIAVAATCACLGGEGPSKTGDDSGRFPRTPEESAGAIKVAPGLRAELFAAEPHIASPVAMAFDADGDVYVAEMLDYPIIRTPGMFGPFPEGQVRLLRTDDRGRVASDSIFATAIAAPTSVVPYDGGVLVSAAPDVLFLKDLDGDGRADVRKVLLTGFDDSQDLYRVNSLQWGNDGWIYGRGVGNTPIHWGDDPEGPALSTEGMDFRFRPASKQFEALSGMSSCFGLTIDDWGRRFFSNSASHVYQVVFPYQYLKRNPFLASPSLTREISDHGGVAQVHRISRPQAWRVERSEVWEKSGLNKKYFGTIEPRQDYMTATCGPKIYRESLLPAEYRGNYFVCEAVGNLVHRDVLQGPGPQFVASRAEEGREFLASADNWCSPVFVEAGPDGALYVVDMYRQIIEHAGADGGREVPNIPLEILQKYGLRAGSTQGRIYRVGPAAATTGTKPRLSRATPRELAERLDGPDAWHRTTAQRLILQSPEKADVEAISRVADSSKIAAARLQALWTLEALGKLDALAVSKALRDETTGVRENALKMAEPRLANDPVLTAAVLGMADDPDPSVRFQLAFTLGEINAPDRLRAMAALAARVADNPDCRTALLSSAGDDGLRLYRMLISEKAAGGAGTRELLSDLARVIGARLDKREVADLLDLIAERPGDSQAVPSLRGLTEGIKRRGKKALDAPGARPALQGLLKSASEDVRKAAGDLATVLRILSPSEREVVVKAAVATARDESKPEIERAEAIRDLGSGAFEVVSPVLGEFLHPRNPEPLQLAAMAALNEQTDPRVAGLLVESWKGLTPTVKAKGVETAMGSKERLLAFLEAVAEGGVSPDSIDAQRRAALRNSPDKEVATKAKAALGEDSAKLDPKAFERVQGALELQGDAKKGRETFKNKCMSCHRVGREGTEIGPNLASVKGRPRDQLLKGVVYPNLTVQPQYMQYVVETTDGRLHTGVVASSGASSITLKRPNEPDVTILRKDVEALSSSQVSIMPQELLDGLNAQEVADLLEYVKGID